MMSTTEGELDLEIANEKEDGEVKELVINYCYDSVVTEKYCS